MSDKRANNLAALRSVSTEDAMHGHIRQRAEMLDGFIRRFNIFRRHKKVERERAQTQIELYIDNWFYQHGNPAPTKETMEMCFTDCIDFFRKLAKANADGGVDANFDDVEMKDFPL
jgi:hypothetical protein